MPRLVDETILGGRETGRTGRPSAFADLAVDKAAIAGVGNSISRLGDVVGSIASQREADDNRIATSTATANLLRKHNEFQQQMRDNPDQHSEWDARYQEHITRAREESAGLIKDERQRKLWQASQSTTIENWQNGVKRQAYDRQRDNFMAQTQRDIEDIRQYALDPNTPDEDRAMQIQAAADMIEDSRRRGFISDQQAQEWSKKWQQGYAVSRLEMMPAKDRVASLAGVKHATPELAGAIKASAERIGISPADLATVISYETGGTFDPWKAGPTTQWGQHRGLIQWGEPQRKKYGVYEGMPVGEQLQAVERYLKDAGVRPGMGIMDVYSAINAGRVGRYNASDAGNGGAPGTVADKVNNQMTGHRAKAMALLGGQSVDPIASMVPPDQRERMYQRARQEVERGDREERINVSRLVNDDDASIRATGKPVQDLTYDRVAQSLGREAADKWEQGRATAKEVFNATQGMEDMTDEQLRAHTDRYRPTQEQAGEGFSQRQSIFQSVRTKSEEILQQRASDPAKSVDNAPGVVQARNALAQNNSVQAREALIAERLKQQELLGVPAYNRSPITVDEAKAIAAKMRPLARGQAESVDQTAIIEGIVKEVEQTYGKYANDVLKRALYQVTLKRDASEVLATAIGRLQKSEGGPLVTTDENRRLQQGEQARSIEQMGSVASTPDIPDPFDGGGYMFGRPPEPSYPVPSAKAFRLLDSNPQQYLPFFIQTYGPQNVPRKYMNGPYIEEMGKGKGK